MKKYLLVIAICLFVANSTSLLADNNNALAEQANKAYAKQDYNSAIELYKKVIDNGYESFKLYYNLGNAYFKSNQIPSAILYYEKAKKLNPSDEDLNFNLNVANNKIVDKIEAIPELFIKSWIDGFVKMFNTDDWARITIVTFCLSLVLLLIYLLSTSLSIRKLAFWFSIFMFIIAIFTFVFAKHQYNDLNKIKEGIVFTPTVNIKSSPDQNSVDIFVIHEGLKVRITDQVGDWYEVRIANGSKGWIKSSDVEII